MRRLVIGAVVALVATTMAPASARAGPPDNDEWTGATPISLGVPIQQDASQATETGSDCYRVSQSVWFKYTPPQDLYITADTTASASLSVGLGIFTILWAIYKKARVHLRKSD